MPLLEIKNLKLEFGSGDNVVRAVDDVSLSIEAGETVCLVGESGSGKSVTALSIARLVPSPPATYIGGEIRLEGADVLTMSKKELQAIRGGTVSYVFQEPGASLNPVFRVGAQIKEALKLHRPDLAGKAGSPLPAARPDTRSGAHGVTRPTSKDYDAEVIRLLKLVGIPAPESRLKDYPHQLSGGMQQRVMIAMAIASHPKLLVADEPTTALDVTIQAQIIDLLRELKERLGMAILLITHNLGIVGDIADRVAVMYAGQIVELAPAKELLRRPLHPYTQALMNSVPKLGEWGEAADEQDAAHRSAGTAAREDARPTKRLRAIPGAVPQLNALPRGCRFAPRCPIAKPECSDGIPELVEVEPKCWVRCPYCDSTKSSMSS